MVRTAVAVQLLGDRWRSSCSRSPTHRVDLLPVPIFVAVASNGAIMGNSAALAMAEVRPVAGTGSAVLGFAQFALGAVVAPLVGLGGETSAVVPALVMAAARRSRVPARRSVRDEVELAASSTATATS